MGGLSFLPRLERFVQSYRSRGYILYQEPISKLVPEAEVKYVFVVLAALAQG